MPLVNAKEMLTKAKAGHYAVGPVLFGTGYVPQKTWWKIGAVLVAFNFVLYMTVGLGYWKVLGLW